MLRHKKPVGQRVAIIGAGGIGFDVAEYLVTDGESVTEDLQAWLDEWGVVSPAEARGGLQTMPNPVVQHAAKREVYLMQRSAGKLGAKLGKTTGWIHRLTLRKAGVKMFGGLSYEEVNGNGLLVRYEDNGNTEQLEVDNVILCAGQLPRRDLYDEIKSRDKVPVYVIGGADVAAELDAKRAINQGTRLAATL